VLALFSVLEERRLPQAAQCTGCTAKPMPRRVRLFHVYRTRRSPKKIRARRPSAYS